MNQQPLGPNPRFSTEPRAWWGPCWRLTLGGGWVLNRSWSILGWLVITFRCPVLNNIKLKAGYCILIIKNFFLNNDQICFFPSDFYKITIFWEMILYQNFKGYNINKINFFCVSLQMCENFYDANLKYHEKLPLWVTKKI